jgi:acetyl-CoA carboxylase carboxyl transferase subunit beta
MTTVQTPALPAPSGWTLCPDCGEPVSRRRLERAQRVCPLCSAHHRLTAEQRLALVLDEGSQLPLDTGTGSPDPLGFVDTLPYPDRLAEARRRTALAEAVSCASGTCDGQPVMVAAMDFGFLGGSLGAAVGDRIVAAARHAERHRIPLVLITASGGARMQEGAVALMQMARACAALADLDRAGVLTIAVITDPTYGGVAASFASACDVILAEPGARLGFAGPRVIAQTIRQQLPKGFQTAEFLVDSGLIDGIRHRRELRRSLARLIAVQAGRRPGAAWPASQPAVTEPACPLSVIRRSEQLPALDAWQAVRLARDLARPTITDYLDLIVDDFEELRGDRTGGDCAAMLGGIGWLAGQPAMFLGQRKGHSSSELVAHNFGMPSPAGYRKAARLMRLAGKLAIPVITLVDTPGAYPGVEAERDGQAMAIAETLKVLADLPTPIVSVVTGEGGSGGALALAAADEVLMLASAVYSVISPEGCASILWQDARAAERAARALRIDARSLLELQVVDGVISEPDGGAQADPLATALRLRAALLASLSQLTELPVPDLLAHRRRRLDRFAGIPMENADE